LSTSRQALLVVAYLRKGETYADLACGFKVGTSTGYRYVREARSRCSPR
jgi:transposase